MFSAYFDFRLTGMLATALILSATALAATQNDASSGVVTDSGEKDIVTVPIRQFGYGQLNSIAYSPDGTKFIAGSADGNARLFDINAYSDDSALLFRRKAPGYSEGKRRVIPKDSALPFRLNRTSCCGRIGA